MATASNMLDWGDNAIGFEQQHKPEGNEPSTHSLVRFQPGVVGNVEISFGSTVHYGGGVQHRADGALVIDRTQAVDLARVLCPDYGQSLTILATLPDEAAGPDALANWARVSRKLLGEIAR